MLPDPITDVSTKAYREMVEQIFCEHTNAVVKVLCGRGAKLHDVQDAVSAVFEASMTKPIFKMEMALSDQRAWLLRCAENRLFSSYRSPRNRVESLDVSAIVPSDEDDDDDDGENSILVRWSIPLAECMERLEAVQRELLQAYYGDGMKYKAIADKLQIASDNVVGKRLQKIRDGLEKCMESNSQ